MSKELFLEIGTEEIPALFLKPALVQLREAAETLFQNRRIEHSGFQTIGTQRRLVLWCRDVSGKQTDLAQEIMGPAKGVAYDPLGQPTPAAKGFAKSQGVTEEALFIKETERGEYLCVKKIEKGQKTHVQLKTLFPELISMLNFPKRMRWDTKGFRFARPIRWIVALFDGRLVPFSIGMTSSDVYSRGHLAYSVGGKPQTARFKVEGYSQYLNRARKFHVLVDPSDRRKKIQTEIEALVRKKKGQVASDEELMDQTVYSVEYPVAVLGKFEKAFLALPKEVLINAMREHQGYFPVVNPQGKLLPLFISVCDINISNPDLIRKGHERVLRARLADAKFFFEKDLKEGLDRRVEELKGMVFQEKLGNLYEKTQRLVELGEFLERFWGRIPLEKIRRSAFLSKADLRTEMVGEFPKLQGIMGGEYAHLQREDPEVAIAISEQYLPCYVGDRLPETDLGSLLAFADKLDTLTGFFGLKKGPTGSQDPYGLRRQALGLIQILLGRRKRLSLVEAITEAIRMYRGNLKRPPQELGEELLEFLKQRVLYLLTQEGFRPDLISAVLSRTDDPWDARERVAALSELSNQTDFSELIVAFKRVVNIIPRDFEGMMKAYLLQPGVEQQLNAEYQIVSDKVPPLIRSHRYQDTLRAMVSLKPSIDTFFDKVLVMDPDPSVRQNRLALLKELRDLFGSFADFSKIQEGETKKK